MKDPRFKTFLKYVVPSVISMASMAVFTMVDSIFVSRGVGSEALAGISVVYPLILFLTAAAALIALGVSTMISSRLAIGKVPEANTAFMSSVWLGCIFFIAVAIPSILFDSGIAGALGASGIIQKYGADYLRTYMFFAIPSGGITILSAAIRNDNNPSLASISLTVSCFANIFLDWLFVYPLKMEVVGAAVATGISQILGLAILLWHFIRKQGELRLSLKIKPRLTECLDMVKRGIPEGINQLTVPVITVCYNLVLARLLGDMGLQAYAIISQPIAVIINLLIGVADGTQPLFSHSHSIGDEDSNQYYLKKSIQMNVLFSLIVYGVFFFFGRAVFQIFGKDPALLDMSVAGNRIYGLNFLFSCITMVIACYFMSIVETKRAMLINILRTFVFNVFFIFATPYILGENMVWAGIVFAEFAVTAVAVILYRNYRKTLEKKKELLTA